MLLYEIDNCDVIAGRRHVTVGLMRPTRRTLCGHWYEMALLTRDRAPSLHKPAIGC